MKARFIRGLDPKDAMNTGSKFDRMHSKIWDILEEQSEKFELKVLDPKFHIADLSNENDEYRQIAIYIYFLEYILSITYDMTQDDLSVNYATKGIHGYISNGVGTTALDLNDAKIRIRHLLMNLTNLTQF